MHRIKCMRLFFVLSYNYNDLLMAAVLTAAVLTAAVFAAGMSFAFMVMMAAVYVRIIAEGSG